MPRGYKKVYKVTAKVDGAYRSAWPVALMIFGSCKATIEELQQYSLVYKPNQRTYPFPGTPGIFCFSNQEDALKWGHQIFSPYKAEIFEALAPIGGTKEIISYISSRITTLHNFLRDAIKENSDKKPNREYYQRWILSQGTYYKTMEAVPGTVVAPYIIPIKLIT